MPQMKKENDLSEFSSREDDLIFQLLLLAHDLVK